MAVSKAPQMLTIPEVAGRLGISRTSVYDLIAKGRIPAHDISSGGKPRLRVEESELTDFIKSTKVIIPPRRRVA